MTADLGLTPHRAAEAICMAPVEPTPIYSGIVPSTQWERERFDAAASNDHWCTECQEFRVPAPGMKCPCCEDERGRR